MNASELLNKNNRISLLFVLFFLGGVCFSFAQTREELEQKQQELRQDIKRINNLLDKTEERQQSVLTTVQSLKEKISKTKKLIRVNNQQANLLSNKIENNQQKISELEENLQALKQEYATMIRKSYRSRSQHNRIMFLLSSESFWQAYKRMQYMKQYADYRRNQGLSIKKKKKQLGKLNTKLKEQRAAKKTLIAENRQTREKLEGTRENKKQLMASIRAKESKYRNNIEEKQRRIAQIDRRIQKIIEKAVAETKEKRKEKTGSRFKMTPEAKALSKNFVQNKGDLPWPVESGRVVMSFGKHPHPVFNNLSVKIDGVRILTEKSSPVKAVFNGRVDRIQAIPGAHKAIFIQHGNYFTVYNNLKDIQVEKGDIISTGDVIGYAAQKIGTNRTILYFAVFKNNTPTNPAYWITGM